MKKKKLRKAPAYLRRESKDVTIPAFFESPYFKYVIAGTAIVLVILSLGAIYYLQSTGQQFVLGAHVSP